MEFKPVEFLVQDLIPAEGVTLLVAKPKVGKSWLLYDLCISAALGREVLGGRTVKHGYSLYLALEDSRRRLRNRAEKLLGFDMRPPTGVMYKTEWPRADQGGLQLIREWVLETRAQGHTVSHVGIDVLEKFRPARRERQPAYQQDYGAADGLRQLTAELGFGVVLAHHQRKAGADDLQDTVLGTQGLTGVVDCVIVIERQIDGGFVFDVRGRDIEARQLAAVFDKETCRWAITGEASEVRGNQTRRAISEAMSATPGGMTPQEVAAETGIKSSTVRVTLGRMARDGLVAKAGSKYRLQ
jgi:RecA-family ATPase